MSPERLRELLDQFPTRRIAVLGDFFLDKNLEVDPALAEPSLETGKTAHQVVGVRCSPGAAGTVVNNLVALRAGTVHAIGAIGDDGEGYSLRQELSRRGVNIKGLVRSDRVMTPTYLKPRDATNADLSGEHSRYDTKNRSSMPGEIVARILSHLGGLLSQIDAVIVLDQVEAEDRGVVTRTVRDAVARMAVMHPQIIFWADSRRRIQQFRNVIIKANQFEAVGRANPLPGEEVRIHALVDALAQMRSETAAPIVVTRGPLGAVVTDPEFTRVPGVQLSGPLDTTGAGDSVTAGAVLALASGATLPEAALVGMLVASITVQQLATTGVATAAQVVERLEVWRTQQESVGTSE